MSLYCFENTRTAEQAERMRRLEEAGICLFCPDGLSHHVQEIVLATAHWAVVPNAFPYAGTSLHLLLVPRQHVSDLLELPPVARADFWEALGAVAQTYRLASYGLGVRNGDCRATGGSIRHVHAHVLVGDAADPGAPPVRMRFSSRPPGGGAGPDRPGSG